MDNATMPPIMADHPLSAAERQKLLKEAAAVIAESRRLAAISKKAMERSQELIKRIGEPTPKG